MRGAFSLILVLTISALPVTAQETEMPRAFALRGSVPGTAPLARAATREAVRLAAAREPLSLGIEAVPQGGAPAASDWSRVRQLAPDTELIVMRRNAGPVHGYFRAASDIELLISNRAAVEHVARIDVVEVRTLKRRDFNGVAHSAFFKWGVVIGLATGLTTAGLTLHSYCKTHTCDTAPAVAIAGYTMLGFMVGGGIGALVAVDTKIDTLIYRA
jgi:hypothetical protein